MNTITIIIEALRAEAKDCRESSKKNGETVGQHFWLMAISLDSLASKIEKIQRDNPTDS